LGRVLIIMRHGEAAPAGSGMGDKGRFLTPHGLKQCQQVGATLRSMDIEPQHIISSDSMRTRQSIEEVLKGGDMAVTPCFTRNFYLKGLSQIVEEVVGLSEQIKIVMVVGHNPGWSDAIVTLTGAFKAMKPGETYVLSGGNGPWHSEINADGSWVIQEVISP